MNKVFFAKMNKSKEIENKTFTASKKSYLNGIDVGDYAFIKPADQKISELWIAKNWSNGNTTLNFEVVAIFDEELSLKQFVALKLFVLDINLLNKIAKPFSSICFFELKLTDGSLDIISDKSKISNYVKNAGNYRKVVVHNSLSDIQGNSQDVQIYLDNGIFNLYSTDFIDNNTILKKFNGNNFKNGKLAGGQKGKLYKIIENGSTSITKDDSSLIGFYDLFISSYDNSEGKKKEFIEWLQRNGVSGAANQYENGLRAIEKEYNVDIDEEYEKDCCRNLLNILLNDNTVIQAKQDKKSNKRNWESYLKKYIAYKENANNDNLVYTVKEDNNSVNDSVLSETLKEFLHSNTIFYGVPGCGKSYHVKQLLKYSNGQSLQEKYFKRILFYPEYSYSDFIGQVMPESIGDKIEYKFQAGPFVEILGSAIADSEHEYFLIIEEINRGNAPAIFGDIFQLLDRDDHGQSEYKIYNRDIINWLKDKSIFSSSQQIYIPSNLTILATMNTSDQNVFVLDTAFKRRWRMSRIKNSFDDGDDTTNTTIKANHIEFTWKSFATALNKDIIENCNDGTIAEDKLLGTHFVKKRELENVRIFAEKVFMYLWNDVVKYNREQLFEANIKTLDTLIDKFVNGENVFSSRCGNLDNLYKSANSSLSLPNNDVNSGNTDE